MRITLIISTIAISIFSIGCVATVPVVPNNGKYGQTFLKGEPVYELEYPDAASCAFDLNQTQLINAEAKKALIEGSMRLECSKYSLVDKLQYVFEVEKVLTGKKFPARVASYDACILLSGYVDKTMKYHC